MQYASKICEDLGIPGKGNIPMVGEAIEAVSKMRMFRGRRDAIRCAYIWLSRRAIEADEQGQSVNNLWFLNGLYKDVVKAVPAPRFERYEHFGEGYGWPDIKFLWRKIADHNFEPTRKTFVARKPRTEAEIEQLLGELDSKRGITPAFRLK
jgi:hypothetical protein